MWQVHWKTKFRLVHTSCFEYDVHWIVFSIFKGDCLQINMIHTWTHEFVGCRSHGLNLIYFKSLRLLSCMSSHGIERRGVML
jgi:hypothetical protein